MFLTDLSSQNLYSTAYGSTTAATFSMETTAMNYTVPTASCHLVIRGENLASAALKKAVYRLNGATADVTKTVTTPQVNHKTITLDSGETLLYWKLDSTTNARIKPLFQEPYASAAESYTLRGLSINVTGQSLHLSTAINEVMFYDLPSLYAAYPELEPMNSGVDDIDEIVNSKSSNSKWYDLQGRRVSNPTKGLYIVNGKKVVIK